MSGDFDPYYKWFGIPPEYQPPNHYRLLGIREFETDSEVIRNAADQRMTYLKTLSTACHAELSQQLLNGVAAAKVCLLNSDNKTSYDAELRARLEGASDSAGVADSPPEVTVRNLSDYLDHVRQPRIKQQWMVWLVTVLILTITAIVIWSSSERIGQSRDEQAISRRNARPTRPVPDRRQVDAEPVVETAAAENVRLDETSPNLENANSTVLVPTPQPEATTPSPELEPRSLYGQAEFNPRTGFLRVTYDFNDAQQLSDFDLSSPLETPGGQLFVPAGSAVLHCVPFVSLRVTAKVEATEAHGPWLQSTSGVSAGSSTGHHSQISFEPDTTAQSDAPYDSSKITLLVDMMVHSDLAVVKVDDTLACLEIGMPQAGQVRLLGASEGITFHELMVEGFVDAKAFREEFDAELIATPDVKPRPPLVPKELSNPALWADIGQDYQNLFDTGHAMPSGSNQQWQMLRSAGQRAIDTKDIDGALIVVDVIEQNFKVDTLGMKYGVLTMFLNEHPNWSPSDEKETLRFIDEAMKNHNFDMAETIAAALYTRVNNRHVLMRKRLFDRRAKIEDARQDWEDFRHRLVTSPPDANNNELHLEAGKRYLCKGNWTEGLSYLANAGHPQLSPLAQQDIRLQEDLAAPAMWKACGDMWGDQGNVAEGSSPPTCDFRSACRLRAAYWYRRSLTDRETLEDRYILWRIHQIDSPRWRKYGGDEIKRAAVRLALDWLNRNFKRGSWSLRGPYSNGSAVENRQAATAMALLAFQGAGHTHENGEYQGTVARAWTFLLESQDPDGSFFRGGESNHRFYTQALTTIAICELLGRTGDKDFLQPAQNAVDYLVKTQSPSGGWRYAPREESDTSVTGWVLMALQSGRMAGLVVPSEVFENIGKYLDLAATDGGARYGYKPSHANSVTMTAEGLLCRQYLGWKRDDIRLKAGVLHILDHPIRWSEPNVYYWYHATQVAYHMEGDYWDEWNSVMRQKIPAKQETKGRERGSWSPDKDRWGGTSGRLYVTCFCTYILEIDERQRPLYAGP